MRDGEPNDSDVGSAAGEGACSGCTRDGEPNDSDVGSTGARGAWSMRGVLRGELPEVGLSTRGLWLGSMLLWNFGGTTYA